MRAWSVKILDVLEDVVHASLHVGERLIDRLVARDRGGGFLADDGFDRELAADLFRERRRGVGDLGERSEEHTSELQSLMRISYAVFCLKKKKKRHRTTTNNM